MLQIAGKILSKKSIYVILLLDPSSASINNDLASHFQSASNNKTRYQLMVPLRTAQQT